MYHKFDPAAGIAPAPDPLIERTDLAIGTDGAESILVRADNDMALSALRGRLGGQVRCVYIDPPYNNMEAWTHYDDRDDHDEWLAKLVRHVGALRETLTVDGSLWVSIDDRQVHYLKVALDEVFGRANFVTTIVWEHRKSRENRKVFSNNHEYLLVYAKDAASFKKSRNRLPYTAEVEGRFRNPDRDPRGPWQSISLNVQDGHATKRQFFTIDGPGGRTHAPPKGRCWMYSAERVRELIDDGRIWFGKAGTAVPRLKRFFSEIDGGLTPHTLWRADEVGTTDGAKKDLLKSFPNESVFDTPKPEALIARILQIAANPGDVVLDSFLGSGTTAVAALRAGMRFVGIECGSQILTHCHRRLAEVAADRQVLIRFLEPGG